MCHGPCGRAEKAPTGEPGGAGWEPECPVALSDWEPAVAIGRAGDVLVCGLGISDLHSGFVPLDALLGAYSEVAEEDELGEGAGVVEVRAGFSAIDDVVGPLALGVVWHDAALFGLFDFAGLHIEAHLGVALFIIDDRAGAVSFAFEDGAFGADEHHAAAGLFE